MGKTEACPISETSKHDPRLPAAAGLLTALLLLATLPYLNTLLNAFVYDDVKQVLANPYLRSWRYLPEVFGSNVWSFLGSAGVTNHYRPMMTFSYLVCYQLFGPLPFGFHLLNLIFHAAVVWILFAVTLRLFPSRTLAFVAAALFALHPIHTESVAWVAGVTDLQLAFFYLLTFHLFLRAGREAPQGGIPPRIQLAMGGSFVLALLSKEIAATLPVLAAIYEHGYRPDRKETTLRGKLQRYGVLWVLLAAYLVFRVLLLGAFAPLLRRTLLTLPETLLSGVALIGAYFWKLVWPAKLSAFYVFEKSESLLDARVLAGAAVLAGACALFAFLWKRNRLLSFPLLWIFVTLAPVLNARWMAANVFAERYLYLPSVGFCWLVAWLWWRAWEKLAPEKRLARQVLVAGLLAVLALYAVRVVTRNRDWRDDEILYKQTLALFPDAYLIRNNLGTVYWNRGERAAAEREWRMALAQQPEDVVLLNNLGLAAAAQDRPAEAEDLYRRAIGIRPAYPEPYVNLGRLHEEAGRLADAEASYRQAIAQAPLHAEARNRLGALLLQSGKISQAQAQFEQSALSLPNADGYTGLGECYLRASELNPAATAFSRAAELDPYDLKAHLGLGKVFAREGKVEDARREFERVLELHPHHTEANDELARLKRRNP